MKPHRVRMAHALILRYGLHKHFEVRTNAVLAWEVCNLPQISAWLI